MAAHTQNGSTGSSQILPSNHTSTLLEEAGKVQLSIAGREAPINLTTGPFRHREHEALPGVSEERRFHSQYPELLIPNDLLRSGLREDYYLGSSPSSSATNNANHIAIGHARGEQYRLYKAIAAVSSASAEYLQCALLVESDHQVRQNEGTYDGVHWRVNSDSHSTQRYTTDIQQVSQCDEADSSFFVVRTNHAVEVISLEILRYNQATTINVKTVFSIDHRSFAGHNPITCNLSHEGSLRLLILTTDGLLRTWRSQSLSPRSQQFPHFVLINALAIPHLDVFRIVPIFYPDLHAKVLLICLHTIFLADVIQSTLKTVYSLEVAEKILAFTSILNTPTESPCYAIATNLRLISLAPAGDTLVTQAAWQHHTHVGGSAILQGIIQDNKVLLFLNSGEYPLCQVFNYDQTTQLQSFNRHRIILDHNNVATAILPYTCEANSATDKSITGVFYVSQNGLLCNLLLSAALVKEVIIAKVRNRVGPAVIQDDQDDGEHPGNHREHITYEDRILLDLSSWYGQLVEEETTEHYERKRVKKELKEPSQKSQLQVGYEELDHLDSLDNVDARMESMVHEWHESGRYANTTFGLRLYDVDKVEVDEESNSVYHLERMMHAWRGNTSFQLRRPANETTALVDDQIRTAARSLALSTVVFGESVVKDPTTVNFSEICNGSASGAQGKNVARILEDWDASAEPETYQWHDIVGGTQASTTGQGLVIPEIPAFLGTRSVMPPVVASSQAAPPVFSATQGVPASSQPENGFAATQPVSGKFGDKKKATNKSKRLRAAGF